MKRAFIAVLNLFMVAATCTTHAAPSKSDAEAWGKDFRRLRDKATDALVLRDALGQPRGALRTQITQLEQRGVKLWGEFADCPLAAQNLGNAFDATYRIRDGDDHLAMSTLARQSFDSGQCWAACRDGIDAAR